MNNVFSAKFPEKDIALNDFDCRYVAQLNVAGKIIKMDFGLTPDGSDAYRYTPDVPLDPAVDIYDLVQQLRRWIQADGLIEGEAKRVEDLLVRWSPGVPRYALKRYGGASL